MKTQKSIWFRPITLAMSIVTVLTFAACGNKGGDGPAAVPMPIGVQPSHCQMNPAACGPMGPGGGGGGGFLVSSMGQFFGSDDVTVQFDFFAANGMAPTGPQFGGGTTPYAGPVMAQGILYVGRPLISCGIPPGAYQVRTPQPGVFGADGTGRSVELAAQSINGPVIIQLSGYISVQSPPAMGRDGRQYPTRLTANMRVSRVDGQGYPCDFTIQ